MSIGTVKGYAAIFATDGKASFPIGFSDCGHLSIPMKGATVRTLHIHTAKLEGTPLESSRPGSQ
jgi:hypothetical protein